MSTVTVQTEIIPRWEWRTFGVAFGPAEEYLAGLEPTGVQESDELYLLSVHGDTVKVRGGLMDIKLLREVGLGGLERWEPILKAPFPLGRSDDRGDLRGLREPMPDLARRPTASTSSSASWPTPTPAFVRYPSTSGASVTRSRAASASSPRSRSASG